MKSDWLSLSFFYYEWAFFPINLMVIHIYFSLWCVFFGVYVSTFQILYNKLKKYSICSTVQGLPNPLCEGGPAGTVMLENNLSMSSKVEDAHSL